MQDRAYPSPQQAEAPGIYVGSRVRLKGSDAPAMVVEELLQAGPTGRPSVRVVYWDDPARQFGRDILPVPCVEPAPKAAGVAVSVADG